MKTQIKKTFLSSMAVLGAILYVGESNVSFAAEERSSSPDPQRESALKAVKHGFKLGVCVGQALATEGIMLPKAEHGTRPELNQETKVALKKAIKECKDQLQGTS